MLSQGEIGNDRPIAYASRLLQGAELNYSTIEKECLAIIYAVQHFRSYVYGHRFTLVTDHRPLIWMNSVKDPISRLLGWRLKLANYDYHIVYKAGKANTNSKALSRNPIPTLLISSGSTADALYTSIPIPSSSRAPPHKTPTQSSEPPSPPATQELSPPPDEDDSCDEANITCETSSVEAHDTRRTIVYIRDRLVNQKGNLLCFVAQNGLPADPGADGLARQRKFSTGIDLVLGRAKVT